MTHIEPTQGGSFVIKEEDAPGVPVFQGGQEIGRVVADQYPNRILIEGLSFRLHHAGVRDGASTFQLRAVYVEVASMWPETFELLTEKGARL